MALSKEQRLQIIRAVVKSLQSNNVDMNMSIDDISDSLVNKVNLSRLFPAGFTGTKVRVTNRSTGRVRYVNRPVGGLQ